MIIPPGFYILPTIDSRQTRSDMPTLPIASTVPMIDREQLLRTAEQAWELRNADPERSRELAAELATEGAATEDSAIIALSCIIELYHDYRSGTPERFLAERERLE